MSAANTAFSTPTSPRGACPSQSRPIDLVHLARQTMGDKTLENEVLIMFARNARRALQDMTGADAAGVAMTAHRLRGAASAVGAFGVSKAAEKLEADGADAAHLAALAACVVEAENFILKLCR